MTMIVDIVNEMSHPAQPTTIDFIIAYDFSSNTHLVSSYRKNAEQVIALKKKAAPPFGSMSRTTR
jgi:hypothetical protein